MPESRPSSDQEAIIRVLVVDDHVLFRQGLVSIVQTEEDIQVVGQATDGEEAVQIAERTQPDIALMDVYLPRSLGFEHLGQLRKVSPRTLSVMLTSSEDPKDIFQALKAGARGYLLKHISADDLIRKIRQVSRGQTTLQPSMAMGLIDQFARLAKKPAAPKNPLGVSQLTARENEVLRLLASSKNNRQIAERLFITENTVKHHVRSILEKLGVHSRTEAAVYAVRTERSY